MHGIKHLSYLYLIFLCTMIFTCFSSYSKELSSCKDAATTTEEQYNAELFTVSFQIFCFQTLNLFSCFLGDWRAKYAVDFIEAFHMFRK